MITGQKIVLEKVWSNLKVVTCQGLVCDKEQQEWSQLGGDVNSWQDKKTTSGQYSQPLPQISWWMAFRSLTHYTAGVADAEHVSFHIISPHP